MRGSMQKFSYHTHTNFSDGRGKIEDMLKQAVNLGWESIGISDHLIVHKNIRQSVSWNRLKDLHGYWEYHQEFKDAQNAFLKQVEEVQKQAKKFPIKVKIGAEVDFFSYDGWEEEFADFRKNVDLDYYISGNHFLELPKEQILNADDAKLLCASDQKAAISKHFNNMQQAVESGVYLFLAHIDYMRRLKICSDSDFMPEKLELVKSLKKSNIASELSTKGLRKGTEFYPSSKLLNLIIQFDIPLIISDDAHRVSELGFEFERAEQYLAKLNYFNRLIL